MVVFGENCDLFIAISVVTGIKRLVGDPTETPTQASGVPGLGGASPMRRQVWILRPQFHNA